LIFLETRNGEKHLLVGVWINGRRGENILWVCCCWVVIWVEKKNKKKGICFGIFHQLPSGLNMEVVVQKGVGDKDPDERIERQWNVVAGL
jgi:hypothetical protein